MINRITAPLRPLTRQVKEKEVILCYCLVSFRRQGLLSCLLLFFYQLPFHPVVFTITTSPWKHYEAPAGRSALVVLYPLEEGLSKDEGTFHLVFGFATAGIAPYWFFTRVIFLFIGR